MGLPLREIWRELSDLAQPIHRDPLQRRDADFIRRHLDILGPIVDAWFAPEFAGYENVPPGRALVVGTHNGGFIGPDLFSFMVGTWRILGPEVPFYGLAHDLAFRLPLVERWLGKIGGVPAHPSNARDLLERDVPVAVYPGGDRDAYKPFHLRHRVNFFGRKGFIRTAIRAGAPIVPMVSAGAHEAVYIISDGVRAAQALKLDDSLRIDILPLQFCLPWGLALGPVPYIPMPCKVKIQLLPAIDLGLAPEDADDDDKVTAAYDRVTEVMQDGLDVLVASGGFGLRHRLTA